MFLLTWLRWLCGTVSFLITGAFPERLINLCVRRKFSVWGISRQKDGMLAHTYAKNYRALRPLARKAGVGLKIQKRSGLPFFCHRNRHRKGLVAGAFVAIALLCFLSTRIWVIEVQGCEEIEPHEIISQLKMLGLTPGVATRRIDSRLMQKQMMMLEQRISWIAINLVGSTAQIELRERVKTPQKMDPKQKACNILAACDGQIRYLEIYEGQAMVKVGDTVRKGEVIVSGILEDQYGNTQLRYARAKVIAQVYEEHTVEVPMEQLKWVPSGMPQARDYLSILGYEIPLFLPALHSGSEAYAVSRGERMLISSPEVFLIEERRIPVRLEAERLTELHAKEIAMRQLSLLSEGERILSVSSRIISSDPQKDQFCLTERLIMEKDIAVESEIFLN